MLFKRNENCKVYERFANTPSEVAQNLYYCPQWAGHFVCNPDFYVEREDYNSILLLYTLRGHGKLNYRDCEYTLTENSIALINCTNFHTYAPYEGSEWDFIFLHFRGNRSAEICEHIYTLKGGCVFEQCGKFEPLMRDCVKLCKVQAATYEVTVSKKISDILYELILHLPKEERNKITIVCDYIAENYSKELSTQKLAEISCFSRCHFSTMFKKITGTTPHDYLLCFRLNKAKTLLLENVYSIAQITEMTGFRDIGTFIRAFKKKEGMTPLQYKKRMCSADRQNINL